MQKKKTGPLKRLKRKLRAWKRKRAKAKKRIGVMDVILVIIGITVFVFTARMIELFEIYGAVPDTLVTCVFALLGGECGIMGWIKTTKERKRERQWQMEDAEKSKADAGTKPGTSKEERPRNEL